MSGFTATQLDALERPVKRHRIGKVRPGAPPERTVQRQIVKALRDLGCIVHHSPNGVKLTGDSEARMKQSAVLVADGMISGFHDLLVINRDGKRFGLIEVKKEGQSLTGDQPRVHRLMDRYGVNHAAVCTLDGAMAALWLWGWL